MFDSFHIPSRISRSLNPAKTVGIIGKTSNYLLQYLKLYYKDKLHFFKNITEAEKSNCHAFLVCSNDPSTVGIDTRDQLWNLAHHRQVVCGHHIFAALTNSTILTLAQSNKTSFQTTAAVKVPAYFLPGFYPDQTVPYYGNTCLEKGEKFAYKGLDIKPVLADISDNHLYALEWSDKEHLVAVLDLEMMENTSVNGFSDLAGFWILQALGADLIDLGFYQQTWLDYNTHIDNIKTWGRLFPELISINKLEPASLMGQSLYKVNITSSTKKYDKIPVIFNCCTHAHEWAATYSIFNYIRWLTSAFNNNDFYARQILDSFEIIWVPVCSVDGFQKTWERGLLHPHSQNNVDLNRNYPPQELWELISDERNPGPHPLSEPETQAIDKLLHKYQHRAHTFIDFHECCDQGFYIHGKQEKNIFFDKYSNNLQKMFNNRFQGQLLSKYNRDQELNSHSWYGNKILKDGPYTAAYAKYLGYKNSCIFESFGNDDFTPFHTPMRTETIAEYCEQVLGSILGNTFYNHTCGAISIDKNFFENNPTKKRKIIISKNDKSEKINNNVSELTLKPGERVTIIEKN